MKKKILLLFVILIIIKFNYSERIKKIKINNEIKDETLLTFDTYKKYIYVYPYFDDRAIIKYDVKKGGKKIVKLLKNNKNFGDIAVVVIDSKSNIITLNYTLKKIQKFDKNGKFIMEFGKRGKKENEFFLGPYDLFIDNQDNIYALDAGKIIKFNSEGKFKSIFKINEKFHSKYGTLGNVMISRKSGKVVCFSEAEKLIGIYDWSNKSHKEISLSKWIKEETLSENYGLITVDEKGYIYIILQYNLSTKNKWKKNDKFILVVLNENLEKEKIIHYKKEINSDIYFFIVRNNKLLCGCINEKVKKKNIYIAIYEIK